MSRPGRVALALLIVMAVGWAEGDEPLVNFIDVTNDPLVRLVFTPPEQMREAPLTSDDVTLTQNGEPVEVILRGLEREPVEVVLLIDTSGSMSGQPLLAARDAAQGFADAVPPSSDIAVVTFGSEVEVVAGFESSREDVTSALADLTARGETALYDALIEAVRLVVDAPRNRQFIVLLSDGGDTQSTAALDDATSALTALDVGFYAVALRGSEFDPAALEAMAAAADGVVVPASDSAALTGIYTSIAEELTAQYLLIFRPATAGPSTFTLTLETATGISTTTFEIDLPDGFAPKPTEPEPGLTTSPELDLTSTTPRSMPDPPVRLVGSPGFWSGEWARILGLGALFAVFAMAFALALSPQEEHRRRGILEGTSFRPLAARGRNEIGFVGRLSEGMQRRIEGMLQKRSGTSPIARTLETAGIALRPGEYLLITILASALSLLLGLAAGGPLLGALLAGGAVLASRVYAIGRGRRRQSAFGDQLEGTLQLIAGSLRAGYGITQSISTVATESAEPTGAEFSRVVVEVRLGRDLIESLTALADRMNNPDFKWVTEAIDIQQGVGGDLAEVLDTVASTIRDRNQIRRQVDALSAEGRLSAIILVSLPFAIAGLISVTNPDYLSELTTTLVGRVLLLVGAGLMAVGIVWIRKIIRIEY